MDVIGMDMNMIGNVFLLGKCRFLFAILLVFSLF